MDHRGDRRGSRPAGGSTPQHYLDLGYEVVASPSDKLYVTPGLQLLPDPRFLFEEWEPLEHPRLDGDMISVGADGAIDQPDSSFDIHLRRPREAMADRVWGGPRRGTVADLFARADAIGSPPGVPEHALPGTLTGTPYGTSPAWGDLPNTYDKVFDGDPSTFFDFAEPSGGYTGIDLGAGNASPVAAIRFVPRNGQLGRMVGGRFEGCTDGPEAAAARWPRCRTGRCSAGTSWPSPTPVGTAGCVTSAPTAASATWPRSSSSPPLATSRCKHRRSCDSSATTGSSRATATRALGPSTTSGSSSAPTPPTTGPVPWCGRWGGRTSLS